MNGKESDRFEPTSAAAARAKYQASRVEGLLRSATSTSCPSDRVLPAFRYSAGIWGADSALRSGIRPEGGGVHGTLGAGETESRIVFWGSVAQPAHRITAESVTRIIGAPRRSRTHRGCA